LPDDIFGIKFDSLPETKTLNIQFKSPRTPVWADFYAKDGEAGDHGTNAIWNAGLTASDWDPPDPPTSGSCQYHILAPDTSIGQPPPGATPELPPGALLLTLIPAAWVGKRKR